MSAHTPTPWIYDTRGYILDSKHDQIGDVTYSDKDGEENAANARLIVQAVNSHESLLALAKELANAYHYDSDTSSHWGDDGAETSVDDCEDSLCIKAREVIQRAEFGEPQTIKGDQ